MIFVGRGQKLVVLHAMVKFSPSVTFNVGVLSSNSGAPKMIDISYSILLLNIKLIDISLNVHGSRSA